MMAINTKAAAATMIGNVNDEMKLDDDVAARAAPAMLEEVVVDGVGEGNGESDGEQDSVADVDAVIDSVAVVDGVTDAVSDLVAVVV